MLLYEHKYLLLLSLSISFSLFMSALRSTLNGPQVGKGTADEGRLRGEREAAAGATSPPIALISLSGQRSL